MADYLKMRFSNADQRLIGHQVSH